MSTMTKEIVHLRYLLVDLGVLDQTPKPLYRDSLGVQIVCNLVFQVRTQHLKIDAHFVQHYYLAWTIRLPHVSSADELVNFFTKAHPVFRFQFLVHKLTLLDPP